MPGVTLTVKRRRSVLITTTCEAMLFKLARPAGRRDVEVGRMRVEEVDGEGDDFGQLCSLLF